MSSIQKETKYIGPSLRAIELGSGNTVRALAQDDRGKEKREHGSIQKETKYIGPSLRAIKLALGNTVQALAQDDKRRGVSS